MAWRCCKDVVPFCAMVLVECTGVGVIILFKAASLEGLSYYVFIAYSYVVSTLVLLLPLPFFHRSTGLPSFKLSLLPRIFLLGVIGFVAQLCGYKGIEYSSPTLASAISNLTPVFTFILAVFFRMEKAALRSTSTKAKILGSIVSISGALMVVLYKGPTILSDFSSSSQSPPISYAQPNSSSQTNWILGGLLLSAGCFLLAIWYIVQTHIIKIYPVEVIVVFLYNLCGTLISAQVCLLAEANWSSWRLNLDVKLAAIIYSGFFSTCFSSLVHTWGLHLKGPLYISIFKPLSIAISAAMSVIFLGDALHLGSVIGAVILSIGFYGVIWGKAREEDLKEDCYGSGGMRPTSDSQSPLLQSHNMADNSEILYSDC